RDDAVPPFLFMSDSDLATALLRDGHHGWAHRHIRVEVRPAGGQIFIVGYATETFPVVTATGGMLDCYECGLVIRGEKRAAQLGTHRHPEKELRGVSGITFGINSPETIRTTSIRRIVAVRGDPQATHGVH